MISDPMRRTQEIFDEALARAPDERAAFVAKACGADTELRAEVESFLAQHDRVGPDFMPPPTRDPAMPALTEPENPNRLVGSSVGRYRIKGVIAAGGMGTVYEAVQQSPDRVVALKVMKSEVVSRSALRRFQFESQVLGRLRHPNVAQVFEAGVHRIDGGSVPYFAMEYVPGAKHIVKYAGDRELSIRDRLFLFAKACDAVHHGHQKGVIHRDLKPANILVDSHGEPKVIDFGVARATDSDQAITTQQTQIGQLIGTVQYMSPEQCDADPLDIDTRSDVYSLGVVLYELLTGELPYDAGGTTIYRATVIIREQSPKPLSEINRKLRGDVEAITLKALAKDRDLRYQSAADLAADLRRHLNGEPVLAGQGGLPARAVRWVLRHPAVLRTAAASCLVVVAVTASAAFWVWWQHVRPHSLHQVDSHEVRLIAQGGTILHVWRADSPGGITFAQLVDRPDHLGGGNLAVLGFSHAGDSEYSRDLCGFDIGRSVETPTWHDRVRDADIPLGLYAEGYTGEQFDPHDGWVFDVFPEVPGDEIVVVFAHHLWKERVIRVYDLTGRPVFQVWTDVGVGESYWMSAPGLLVILGIAQTEGWMACGYERPPVVVFALRPQRDFISQDLLQATPGKSPLHAPWFKYLSPPAAVNRCTGEMELSPPLAGPEPSRHVILWLKVSETEGAGTGWILDASGNEVPDTRVISDGYVRNQKLFPDGHPDRLPDPKEFELLDWAEVLDRYGPDSSGKAAD